MSDNKDNLKDLESLLVEDMKQNSMIMLYINSEGEVVMFSIGEYTKQQQKIAEELLITVGSHSFVFAIVLKLEILFSRLTYSLGNLFRKLRS